MNTLPYDDRSALRARFCEVKKGVIVYLCKFPSVQYGEFATPCLKLQEEVGEISSLPELLDNSKESQLLPQIINRWEIGFPFSGPWDMDTESNTLSTKLVVKHWEIGSRRQRMTNTRSSSV